MKLQVVEGRSAARSINEIELADKPPRSPIEQTNHGTKTLLRLSTGTTGYVGGDFLYLQQETHPDWEVTCLVRNSDKGAKIVAVYPSIKLVYGDLSSVELIEEEVSKADIVYHFASSDDEPSANAIARGLCRRQSSDTPGYWIQTSGTLILATETVDKEVYGDQLPKVFNDWDGISELISFPDHAAHRNVDKIVLASSSSGSSASIRTAIVCPPTIYGRGRGPDNQRSIQIYQAANAMLRTKSGFKIGKGENIWHQVHVRDLSKLYLLLGEAAAANSPNDGAPATWNEQGYYFAESGKPFVWGEILTATTAEAYKMGYLENDKVQSVTPDEAEKLQRHAKYSFGTNSRGISIRAGRVLGWEPKESSLEDEIPEVIRSEASLLGLKLGHAAKVSEEMK